MKPLMIHVFILLFLSVSCRTSNGSSDTDHDRLLSGPESGSLAGSASGKEAPDENKKEPSVLQVLDVQVEEALNGSHHSVRLSADKSPDAEFVLVEVFDQQNQMVKSLRMYFPEAFIHTLPEGVFKFVFRPCLAASALVNDDALLCGESEERRFIQKENEDHELNALFVRKEDALDAEKKKAEELHKAAETYQKEAALDKIPEQNLSPMDQSIKTIADAGPDKTAELFSYLDIPELAEQKIRQQSAGQNATAQGAAAQPASPLPSDEGHSEEDLEQMGGLILLFMGGKFLFWITEKEKSAPLVDRSKNLEAIQKLDSDWKKQKQEIQEQLERATNQRTKNILENRLRQIDRDLAKLEKERHKPIETDYDGRLSRYLRTGTRFIGGGMIAGALVLTVTNPELQKIMGATMDIAKIFGDVLQLSGSSSGGPRERLREKSRHIYQELMALRKSSAEIDRRIIAHISQ